MTGLRPGSSWSNDTPNGPEIHLARQTEDRWTLTDGDACIEANAEAFVPVEQ